MLPLGDGILHVWERDLSLKSMATKKNPKDNGRLSGDPGAAAEVPASREPLRNGHLFAVQTQKVVTIEGITVEGVLKEMMIAYQTTTEKGTNDTCGVKRWRRVLRNRPDQFIKILESLERKMEANRKHSEEFEALGKRKGELETENAALKSKIGELEAELPEQGEDEYAACLADPTHARLKELERRLIREASGLEECPKCSQPVDSASILEEKCVRCWAALAKKGV